MSLLTPELQAFLAIVKCHTVIAASRELHLTQTGVTQRIRKLERELQVTLFTRSRTGMLLTQEGKALSHYCQGARELEGETLARLRGNESGHFVELTIAGPSSIMVSRVIPAMAILKKKLPGLQLRFNIVDDQDLELLLKTGSAELVILQPERVTLELDSKMLKPELYRFVVAYSWSTRSIRDIVETEQIVDFDPNDELTHRYLRAHGLIKFARRDRQFSNQTHAIASMVSMEMGYSVLTTEFAQSWVDRNSLAWIKPNQTYSQKLALAWYPRPQMPVYFKMVVDSIY